HMRERVAGGDEMWMNPLQQAAGIILGNAEQADAITKRCRLGDIGREQMADAAGRHVTKGRPGAEGEAGEDRELMCRIYPVDVEAWIGLRKAERLRLGKHLGEVAALLLHLGQDEIAGAVEDAV